MNPLISTCCVSPSTGEDHHEDRISPFPTKSKNTEIDSKKNFSENDIVGIADPVGDALQSTALRSTDDDGDDDNEVIQWWNPTS